MGLRALVGGVVGVLGLGSSALLAREATVVVAMGAVLVTFSGLLFVAKVVFHDDDVPYRRLRGLLREVRSRPSRRLK